MSLKRSDHTDPDPSSEPDVIARRRVLQTLLGGAGAAVALPGALHAQHRGHQQMANPAVVAAAQEKAASAAFTPEFLDAHQFQTLEVLAEAIVPGSTEAKVAPFLDTLLAVENSEEQQRFLSALGAFDMMAIEAHRKPWSKLTAAEQTALLEKASTTAPGRGPGGPFGGGGGGGKTTIGDHFNAIKGAVSSAYYSSEKGMRELGWTGNVFHQSLPGCEHPEGHSGGNGE